MNYFEVFGLPRRLAVDTAALQQRFYDLSRRHHPDFQQDRPAAEQAAALATSALVNTAYRALRDPVARIEYLARLEEGRETKEGASVKPKAPPDLLAEMFEIQESLAEAKTGSLDEATRAALAGRRQRLQERFRAEEARLCGPLADAWDAAGPAERPGALAALTSALATRAYLRTVIDDLGQTLDNGQETHVAHHRH